MENQTPSPATTPVTPSGSTYIPPPTTSLPPGGPIPPIETAPPKRRSWMMIVGILVVLILLSIGSYMYYLNMQSTPAMKPVETVKTLPTLIPTMPPTESASNASTASTSADWKAYTNTTISFTYPFAWIIDTDTIGLIRLSSDKENNPETLVITIVENNKSLDQIIQELGGVETKEQMILAKNQATKISGKSGVAGMIPYIVIITTKNDKTYTIKLTTNEEEFSDTALETFDQLISTFTFKK